MARNGEPGLPSTAARAARVILVERHDIATGATRRNHGLLRSGARYAVTGCGIGPRMHLVKTRSWKRIVRHCVEPTNGLFITPAGR